MKFRTLVRIFVGVTLLLAGITSSCVFAYLNRDDLKAASAGEFYIDATVRPKDGMDMEHFLLDSVTVWLGKDETESVTVPYGEPLSMPAQTWLYMHVRVWLSTDYMRSAAWYGDRHLTIYGERDSVYRIEVPFSAEAIGFDAGVVDWGENESTF